MRLDVSAAGAVAYVLVVGAAARVPPATTMEARREQQIDFQVFSRYLNRYSNTTIQWKLLDSDSAISISNVSLHRIANDGRLVSVAGEGQPGGPARQTQDGFPVVRGTPGNRFFEATSERGTGYMSVGTRELDSVMVVFPYNTQATGGSATFLVKGDTHFRYYMDQDLINTALCLSVGWDGEQPMRAYSHAFAITEETDLSGQIFKTLNETFERASSVAGRYEGPDVPPETLWVAPLSSSGAAAASADSTSADPTSAAGDRGGPGLSVAAKAGIGVGTGIAGLLLLGGLVFFFLRQRRQRRGPKPYGRGAGADFASDSGVMVRDKEMAGVSQSGPHSLYAPDPGRLHDHDTPADSPVAVRGGGGDPRHSGYHGSGDVESYHAEPAPGGTDRGAAATPTDHAPSRPTSEVRSPSRYAHLIEEGMTQDEIQRLEEEERQLDAAIESAGRRSRSA